MLAVATHLLDDRRHSGELLVPEDAPKYIVI